jgi:hypothetical protein
VNPAAALEDTLGLREERHEAAALLVDSLGPAEGRRLCQLLDEARAIEAADVASAVDAMVAAIPPVLRGRVRKVLQRDER